MWFLGNCYKNGTGITRDLSEARRWYERAAAAGSELARVEALKALAALDAAEARAARARASLSVAAGSVNAQSDLARLDV